MALFYWYKHLFNNIFWVITVNIHLLDDGSCIATKNIFTAKQEKVPFNDETVVFILDYSLKGFFCKRERHLEFIIWLIICSGRNDY